MRAILLSLSVLFLSQTVLAQDSQIHSLPPGKYEASARSNQVSWDLGDIILLPEQKYKLSTSDEVGEYKFSVTAQRIFFTSGPLKSLYAKTALDQNNPAIVFPASQNAKAIQRIPADIVVVYRN